MNPHLSRLCDLGAQAHNIDPTDEDSWTYDTNRLKMNLTDTADDTRAPLTMDRL